MDSARFGQIDIARAIRLDIVWKEESRGRGGAAIAGICWGRDTGTGMSADHTSRGHLADDQICDVRNE